jgi:hypothetical protein
LTYCEGEVVASNPFRYVAQAYSQGTSPLEMYSFVASAKDFKQWGGVPAKTSRFHGGFQRALGKRYEKIKKFFDQGQASPTSIVVAFRENVLEVADLGYPENWPASGGLSTAVRYVTLAFSTDVADMDSLTLDELRARVCAMLKPRLGESASPTADDAELDALDAEDEEEDDIDEDDVDLDDTSEAAAVDPTADADADATDSDELDVGYSQLNRFYQFIADDSQVAQWIKERHDLIAEIKAGRENKGKRRKVLPEEPESELRSLLVSLLRPAMIVDGQHRVWGAYESDHADEIMFTVNAIRDADWVEQVFQFVVLNKQAKPISKGFLTSILNTSLTNSEVDDIEERLETIGIKSTDRKLMKYLNHDPRSPFTNMIAEPGEMIGAATKGRLSSQGMLKLIRRWHSISSQSKSGEMKMFFPALGVKTLTAAREKWKSYDTWVPYFWAFWTELRAMYEPDAIWAKADGFELLLIVTMHTLQDYFIDAKAEGGFKFRSVEDFRSEVHDFFDAVPAAFFRNWSATGLQSGDGPTYIRDAIKRFRNGTTLETIAKESQLYAVKKIKK